MLPLTQLRGPLMTVAIPSLSRLQNEPERFRNYYLKMLQVMAFLSFPLVAFLGAFSRELLLLVLGPQWEEAAVIFTILAFIALLQPVVSTVGTVLVTLGQTGKNLRIGVIFAAICVLSFIIGLPWGARGVATCYALSGYATFIPYLYFSLKDTPIPVRDFLKVMVMPVPATIGMVLAARGIAWLTPGLPGIAMLPLAALTGGLVYLGIFYIQPGGVGVLEDLRSNLQLILKPAAKPSAKES
jgi:O-antigen/teichoic acid export membrane protein